MAEILRGLLRAVGEVPLVPENQELKESAESGDPDQSEVLPCPTWHCPLDDEDRIRRHTLLPG